MLWYPSHFHGKNYQLLWREKRGDEVLDAISRRNWDEFLEILFADNDDDNVGRNVVENKLDNYSSVINDSPPQPEDAPLSLLHTPLHLLVLNDAPLPVVRRVVSAGAWRSLRSRCFSCASAGALLCDHGETPAEMARRLGKEEMERVLTVDSGVDDEIIAAMEKSLFEIAKRETIGRDGVPLVEKYKQSPPQIRPLFESLSPFVDTSDNSPTSIIPPTFFSTSDLFVSPRVVFENHDDRIESTPFDPDPTIDSSVHPENRTSLTKAPSFHYEVEGLLGGVNVTLHRLPLRLRVDTFCRVFGGSERRFVVAADGSVEEIFLLDRVYKALRYKSS